LSGSAKSTLRFAKVLLEHWCCNPLAKIVRD